MAAAIFGVLLCYVAIGLAVGCAFVLVGATHLQAAPVSAGARILLLPGAVILWPLILARWLKRGDAR
jgi:hypothetical protein